MTPHCPVKFGTDGWRAVIGEDYTFENIRLVAQATADYFARKQTRTTRKRMVVGYDRRFLSDEFAQTTAEVLTGNGYEVLLSDRPVPTPAVSWHTARQKARAGIMITASHNPARFNGFKIKLHHGGPADPNTCRAIEQNLQKRPVKQLTPIKAKRRKLLRTSNLLPKYFSALKRLVNFDLIQKTKLHFAHEALFGVGAGCFDQILEGTQCTVRTFNADHDPNFGGLNPEPIERNYVLSQRELKRKRADFCLVTDGDADRIGGMMGDGQLLTTHQIICLLLRHFIKNRKGQGRAVKALTTTSMVDVMCKRHGLSLTETGVGFKYICEEMLQGDVLLGFEESGGIGFPGHVPERDGILAGLMILELLATERTPLTKLLSELTQDYGHFAYDRIDTHYPLEKRAHLMQFAAANAPKDLLGSPIDKIQTFDGVKYTARCGSWLMLRGSGTEPVLRIYAEGPTQPCVARLLDMGQSIANRANR